jgi:hypothetical protein
VAEEVEEAEGLGIVEEAVGLEGLGKRFEGIGEAVAAFGGTAEEG